MNDDLLTTSTQQLITTSNIRPTDVDGFYYVPKGIEIKINGVNVQSVQLLDEIVVYKMENGFTYIVNDVDEKFFIELYHYNQNPYLSE